MNPINCSYQGIEGSHSLLVLSSYFRKIGQEFASAGAPTFRQVAMNVISGKAAVGILPVDNAIAGTVRDGYDLLAQYNLVPIAEIDWKMDHRLLAPKGATIAGLREVWGHPLVLQECGKFLGTLTGARVIPNEDTGLAAKQVAESQDPTLAAIAPAEAAKLYGLEELAEHIADHPENYTRFIIFRAAKAPAEAVALEQAKWKNAVRKTSLILSTSHNAGSLSSCLAVFADAQINVSKLESRPKLEKTWEYSFYLDFEGDVKDAKVAAAIEKLRQHTVQLQVIGSYDSFSADSLVEGHAPAATMPAAAAAEQASTISAPELSNEWSLELLPKSYKGWPKVARTSTDHSTTIKIGPVSVGGDNFVVIAGPCSVESRDQLFTTARAIRERGAVMLRGGAFKPRTNPYAFQGMGWDGVSLLAEAGRATGMPIVSEVMSVDQVERMAREVDVLQVGARNMQNFDLLKALGKTDRTVLLKRGLSASLEEFLGAAEYILAGGNPHVILCERGIRTFETATRNTLDLSAVPVLRERTHLPIVVDPSHGVGVRRWIRPLCRAAKAVGANGILVEVHPNPPEAKSDKDQALTFEDFRLIMDDLRQIPLPRLP